MAQVFAKHMGCKSKPRPPVVYKGPAVQCNDLCSGSSVPLWMCEVFGGQHNFREDPKKQDKGELIG